jgi:phosphopantetheinyl transferase
LELEKDTFGKPHFVHDTRFISLSHCKGYAAAISGDVAVGIDVELVSSRVQRIKNRFLSPEELQILGDTDAMLMLAWSAKEAVYKMYGQKGLIFKTDMCIREVDAVEQQLKLCLTQGGKSENLKLDFMFVDGLVMSWVVEPVSG